VKTFLQQRHALAERERQLIADLNRVLPQLGYHVVPIENGTPADASAAVRRAPASPAHAQIRTKTAPRSLACPRCSRRFAHPLHLGRHISATHGIRRKTKRA
jgi:uncharacterized C2H2 Zn-finger protein